MRPGLIVPVVIVLLFAVPALIVYVPVESLEAYMMKKITPPQDEAMVQRWTQWLEERNFDQIERGLDPSLRANDVRDKLETMAQLIPPQQPTSVKVIGYIVAHHRDSSSTTTTTLEYEFSDGWLIASLVKEERAGASTVTGFHVQPISESVESRNRFTLFGKEPVHYVVLLLSLAALAVSAYGVIASLRVPMGKKKWLWAAVCSFGVGRLAINWTTGAVGFTPLWIGFPPSGAVMIPLYSPWVVYSSLPVGAVVFLMLRDRLILVRPTPEAQQASPTHSTVLPS